MELRTDYEKLFRELDEKIAYWNGFMVAMSLILHGGDAENEMRMADTILQAVIKDREKLAATNQAESADRFFTREGVVRPHIMISEEP